MTNEQLHPELLPCPFCGPRESVVSLYFDDMVQRYRVGCGRCGASTGIHPRDKTEAPAIAAWNRHADLQSQDREDIKEVIERLPRYKFGYISDEWGMGRHLGAIRHDNGRFLRIDEVMTAIDHARREGGARHEKDGLPLRVPLPIKG